MYPFAFKSYFDKKFILKRHLNYVKLKFSHVPSKKLSGIEKLKEITEKINVMI